MSRILLIDDDASLLDALSIAFEEAGHDVLTAADGLRGFDAVKKESPDAVVSDVNMPGLDGFALCKRLRDGGNGVPLVLLTSRDNEIDEALGLELGADDYVAKPFSTRVLLARGSFFRVTGSSRSSAGMTPSSPSASSIRTFAGSAASSSPSMHRSIGSRR